jgi:starch phosphorylase
VFLLAKEKKVNKVKDKAYEKLKNELKTRFISTVHIMWGRELHELTKNEIYQTVASVAKQYISDNWIKTNRTYDERQEKQVYYFSIEFLLGRLLKSNLINLGIEEAVQEVLQDDFKLELSDIYEEEPDAGLGNGGLGRLAACFIDSMAAHRLAGHGCSLHYQFGLFEQKIIDGQQAEIPDNWLKNGFAWEYRKADKAIDVKFFGNAYMKDIGNGELELVYENPTTVMAVPYDVPVVGYHNNTVNNLRLWNAEVNRDFSDYGFITHEQLQQKEEYRRFVENITRYLYPDDSSYEGRQRRLIVHAVFLRREQLRPQLLIDLLRQLRMILQIEARVVPPLSQAHIPVAEEGAALVNNIPLHGHIQQRPLRADALAVDDIELSHAERRSHLVLDNLHLRPVADHL